MKEKVGRKARVSSTTRTKQSKEEILPSWNEGTSKKSIINFVNQVTDSDSDDYLEVEDRIAVFDNDGTLWTEYPYYIQFQFLVDRLKSLYPQHPEWKDTQPYKGILEGDIKTALSGGLKAIEELLIATHAGMTSSEFEKLVKNWTATAVHPQFRKLFTQCVYQPMLELLSYLRSKQFKTYIVSGGGVEFMRPWVEETYGIPREQVIGSSIKTKYEVRNGAPEFIRLPEINFVDDKEGKPIGIYQAIGKKPVAAFGNSDGDFQMLEWITSGKNKSLGMLIHHDDAEREFAYDKEAFAGKLVHGLEEAKQRGWEVISMKKEWKDIF